MRGSDLAASLMPRANVTAVIILAINVVFFALQVILQRKTNNPNFDMGVEFAPYIYLYGQYWRLITAGFLHGGLLHIAMNSWSLFILVSEVELFYGTPRMLVAYVFSTFTGFVIASVFTPHSPVLGASCAAFGLMGTMLAMGIGRRAEPLTQAVRQHYGQWLIFGLVMSFGGGISLSGHVGGLIGGFVSGLVMGRPGLPGTFRENFWKIVAFVAVAIVILSWYKAFLMIQDTLRHLSAMQPPTV